MNLKDCYNTMYADYEEVMSRLHKEERVIGYLGKFLEDKSFARMVDAIHINDYPTALNEVITLIGICENLGLKILSKSLGTVSYMLRKYVAQELIYEALEKLNMDYEYIVGIIKKIDELEGLDD